MTHTIEVIGIPDEMLERLDSRARERHAPNRSEYILGLIHRDLTGDSGESRKAEKTMAVVLAPFHEAVQASGHTEEEAIAIFDAALQEVRAERRLRRAQPSGTSTDAE